MAKKKFTEQDMYPAAYTAIRNRYSANEGWEIKPQDSSKEGYRPDFVVEKPSEKGFFYDTPKKKIIVEVKAEPKIKEEHIKQLTGYAQKHGGGNSKVERKHLVVPAGADLNDVRTLINKHDIDVIWLKGFQR